MSFMDSLGLVIGVLFCGLFALMCWIFVFRSLSRKKWVPVDGRVIYAFVEESKFTNRHGKRSYFPVVCYAYKYKGRRYQGDSISVANFSYRFHHEAETIIQPFVKGAQIQVYVDPRFPNQSALFSQIEWGFLFGAVFLSANCLFFLYFLIKSSI